MGACHLPCSGRQHPTLILPRSMSELMRSAEEGLAREVARAVADREARLAQGEAQLRERERHLEGREAEHARMQAQLRWGACIPAGTGLPCLLVARLCSSEHSAASLSAGSWPSSCVGRGRTCRRGSTRRSWQPRRSACGWRHW